ncbi:MAG: TonB-dependent receptor [Gemmatimonadetes bacterium]|nr:TonB-dependent receptor [Gemmatimonadota bacterium]
MQYSSTNSSVLQLNSSFGGGIFNELRMGYNRVRDHRDIGGALFPRVQVNVGTRNILAGSENSSVANVLDQDAFEITDDLTLPLGAHTITLGTNNEFDSFSNLFAQNIYGFYRFPSIAAFVAGNPDQYQFRYLVPDADPTTPGNQPGKERAEFKFTRYSLYAQDRWSARDNLELTLGLRVEMPTFPKDPVENPLVFSTYGRHTSEVPNSQVIWNPRFGFNWDVTGDQATQVRGGAGFFSGRAPGVWISNAYGNTGLEYISFTCTNSGNTVNTPAFNPDPNSQSRNCAGTTSPAPTNVNLVDPKLKLPQIARFSLGVDRRLPFGLIGTLEGLYTKTIQDLLYQNLRIQTTGATVEGRPQYSLRTTPGLGDMIDVTNTDQGYTYSLTGQVQRPFRNNWDFSLAYTFSRSMDQEPLGSSTAFSNWQFNVTRNDPNNPELTRSDYDIPHRIVGSTSYRLNLLRHAATDLSLVYVGQSGKPFSYRYTTDINGDGGQNDLVFVPADPSQIRFASTATVSAAQAWQNLNDYIENTPCLREARGTVVKRNTCREPWSNRVDLRVAQSLSALNAGNAQITLDILNFGNLLNREWGTSDFVNNQTANLLALNATNNLPDANGRRLYQPFLSTTNALTRSNLDSRYQIQLGLRYSF